MDVLLLLPAPRVFARPIAASAIQATGVIKSAPTITGAPDVTVTALSCHGAPTGCRVTTVGNAAKIKSTAKDCQSAECAVAPDDSIAQA